MEREDIFRFFAEGRPPQFFPSGKMIYLQGTEAQYFYYLASGSARSYISSEDGEERTLTVHRKGDIMGEASFFDEQPRVSSAVAVTDCQIVSIDRNRLTAVFAAHPELSFSMLQYLARTVRLLSVHVDDMSFLSADQRIARFLLEHAPKEDTLTCTHEEIGSAIGVSRVTVSRILSDFSDRGWLKTAYRSVELLDRAALLACVHRS